MDFLKKYDKDFKPHKNAVVTLDLLEKLIHIFIIDVYHQSYHRGAFGKPAKIWEKGVNETSLILPFKNPDELLYLLYHSKKAAVTIKGIEYKDVIYNSKELQRLRTRLKGEKVWFKYNSRDISIIYVYDPLTGKYLHTPATNQKYTRKLSMRQHDVIRKFRKNESTEDDKLSLIYSKELIFQLVQEEKAKLKIKARKMIAAFQEEKQIRRTSGMDFSEEAIEIIRKLDEMAAGVSSEEYDGENDEQFAKKLANNIITEEIRELVKGDSTIKSKSKPKASKKTKKIEHEKTLVELAEEEIDEMSVGMDNDKRWGSYLANE